MNKSDIKTEWDLSLFYDEATAEEAIEEDLRHARGAYEAFAEKYREDESYLEDPAALAEALKELEYLGGEQNLSKPYYYYHYRKELDATDQTAESKMNQLSQEYTKLGNLITFFELKLGNIFEKKQAEFLAADQLSHYHKYLEWLFKTADYQLAEAEENILSRTSLPRVQMWVSGVQKALNQKTVEWEGEQLPLPKALNQLHDLPTKQRRQLHQRCMEKLKELKEFSESELNAVVTNKKIVDEMRGYETPYEASVLSDENTPEEVETLVETVTDNFDVAGEFYELKARLLDEETLTYADRQASVGEIDRDFSFESAVDLVEAAFADADQQFADIFTGLLAGGQVDVYPREGKSGGAYCSSAPYLPTLLLLNHVDNYKSLTTLVHEMGHAIHTKLSKTQTPLYQEYTIPVAETASTFFEKVFFNHLFPQLTDEEKIIALHDKINGKISVIFRQIAFFNFEKELHERIREEGSLSHDEIARLMNQHMQTYLGDRFELTEDDGYFFVTVSHIRRFFYVYSYAYGDLISSALHDKLAADDAYVEEIKQFLSAGSSKSPQQIFADIGIDTTTPTVFETGIQAVRDDIETLRSLVKS